MQGSSYTREISGEGTSPRLSGKSLNAAGAQEGLLYINTYSNRSLIDSSSDINLLVFSRQEDTQSVKAHFGPC